MIQVHEMIQVQKGLPFVSFFIHEFNCEGFVEFSSIYSSVLGGIPMLVAWKPQCYFATEKDWLRRVPNAANNTAPAASRQHLKDFKRP
jgi:hypothetical protein